MRYFFFSIIFLLLFFQHSVAKEKRRNAPKDSIQMIVAAPPPFDDSYMAEYSYLSTEEKAVYYYLNYARQYPKLFAERYVKSYDLPPTFVKEHAFDERKASLIEMLMTMEPVATLVPDESLYQLAYCFAHESGFIGIEGHNRRQTKCKKGYDGECCQYGFDTGFRVVMACLIDAGYNNEKLKHRQTCLDPCFTRVGVAIQPHKVYKINTVIDFGY